jgi:hypothetical protein
MDKFDQKSTRNWVTSWIRPCCLEKTKSAYIVEPLLYWWPCYNYNYKKTKRRRLNTLTSEEMHCSFIQHRKFPSSSFQFLEIFTLWSLSFFILQFYLSKLFWFVIGLGTLFSMHAYGDLEESRKYYVARLSLDFAKQISISRIEFEA